MNFGIHLIKNKIGSSFFVTRPFGNYLIFADYIDSFDSSYIESQGGLSKMLFESRSNISAIHAKLFDKYGASAVSDFISEEFNPNIPLQRWNYEHVDPALEWYHHGEKQIITFKQKDKIVSITGNSIELKNNQFFYKDKDISSELIDYFKKHKTDLVYASNFINSSCVKLKF